MSEDNTQAVVENAEGQAAPVTGADSARTDDLDSALNEFDSQVAQTSSQTRPEQTAQAAPSPDVAKRLEQLERQIAEENFNRSIEPVIKRVRGDVPADVLSDQEVLDLLNGRAQRDPRLASAWINRATNPKAWEKVESAISRELQTKFAKLPDRHATEDREAVTAAVRGASTRAPAEPPLNIGKMNNAEAAAEIEKRYGYRPNF